MKEAPALLICMGVSGCGKSTVATSLADQFDLEFIEADEFHSDANRAHMAAGNALDESMRRPWIDSICDALGDHLQGNRNCVLACSGLRRAHRQRFRELGFRAQFIHLCGDKELMAARMTQRRDHFMPTELLDSQYSDLEATDDEADIVSLDIKADLPQVLSQAAAMTRIFLQSKPAGCSSE